MAKRLRLSNAAQQDLLDIWLYTAGMYGLEQADRYDTLLRQAFLDIVEDPARPGSLSRSEIAVNLRSYHVALSAKRSGTGIKSPRHVVLYAEMPGDVVGVSRVLHDAMDLERHVPEGTEDLGVD